MIKDKESSRARCARARAFGSRLLWADTSRARTARAPLLWQTRAGLLERRFAEAIAEAVEWKHGQLLIRAIAAATAATAAAADTAWI